MTSFGFGCVRMTSEGLCYLAAAACGPGVESQGRLGRSRTFIMSLQILCFSDTIT